VVEKRILDFTKLNECLDKLETVHEEKPYIRKRKKTIIKLLG